MKVEFNEDGSIKMPKKVSDDSEEGLDENKDPLYFDIVDRIFTVIKVEFGDSLRIDNLKVMSRIYSDKPLKARCKYLYWVDFKKYDHNGKWGLKIHLQEIEKYFGEGYVDPEGRLDTSISFMTSKYPCFVISEEEQLDDYFDRIIKTTYGKLVHSD